MLKLFLKVMANIYYSYAKSVLYKQKTFKTNCDILFLNHYSYDRRNCSIIYLETVQRYYEIRFLNSKYIIQYYNIK